MQDEPYRLIPLRARDGSVRAHAIVDAADVDWLSGYRWSLHSGGYVQHGTTLNGRRVVILMHRHILGLGAGDPREGDHRNGCRLDNRRANLRIVPRAGNAQNRTVARGSSRYIGVIYRAEYDSWTARVKISGRAHAIGDFATELDAAAAAAQFRHAHMPYAIEDPVLLGHVVAPESRRRTVYTLDHADEIVRRWARGDSMHEIAATIGFSRPALSCAMTKLRKLGYDLPYRAPAVAAARRKS